MKIRRLKKLSVNDKIYRNTLNQVSNEGRNILKLLEDFKFNLEQSAKLLNNDTNISQGLINKKKIVDEISGKLYQIIFDVENINISNSFFSSNDTVLQIPDTNNIEDNNDKNVPPNFNQNPNSKLDLPFETHETIDINKDKNNKDNKNEKEDEKDKDDKDDKKDGNSKKDDKDEKEDKGNKDNKKDDKDKKGNESENKENTQTENNEE